MSDITMRAALTDAIRYWERGRILYNTVLAIIVIAYFAINLPGSKGQLSFGLLQGFFVLAVLANIAYCAAYPIDVFTQLSGVRAVWVRYRWVLLVVGILFAAIFAQLFSQSLFANAA